MKYSEEELKAIERLDRLTIGTIIQTTDIDNASLILHDKIILLNLIEKQQKEIENSVSKDKIRNKKQGYKETIKHLGNDGIELDMKENYEAKIELCDELLEE